MVWFEIDTLGPIGGIINYSSNVNSIRSLKFVITSQASSCLSLHVHVLLLLINRMVLK